MFGKLLLTCAVILTAFAFAPRKVKWVAIGDSITYLNDHPDETGNRITKGYMTRVAEKLPVLEFINQGHNGWTSVQIAKSIEKLGLQSAAIYSVFLGTNDWWQGRRVGTLRDYREGTGTGTVCGSFRVIVNKLRLLNHNAKIVLITPMQRVDFVYINDMKNNAFGSYKPRNGQSLEQFALAIDSIAVLEGFDLVDLYHEKELGLKNLVKFKRLKDPHTGVYRHYQWPDFVDVPFDPAADEYPYPLESMDMTYDGLHPSDKGYAVIARNLRKVMKKIVREM